ncbi:hypothetical protein HDE_06462 [Halotydeus destructor]|nr:hypothetical protein HDE_06462 [Halotydeus destructor]
MATVNHVVISPDRQLCLHVRNSSDKYDEYDEERIRIMFEKCQRDESKSKISPSTSPPNDGLIKSRPPATRRCCECSKLRQQLDVKDYIVSQFSHERDAMKSKLTRITNKNVELELKLEKYKNMLKKSRHFCDSQIHGKEEQIASRSEEEEKKRRTSRTATEKIDSVPKLATSASTRDNVVLSINSSNQDGSSSKLFPDLELLRTRCQELEGINLHLSQHLTKLKDAFNELHVSLSTNSNVQNNSTQSHMFSSTFHETSEMISTEDIVTINQSSAFDRWYNG